MGLFDFFKKKKENDEEIALDKALNIKEMMNMHFIHKKKV